MRRIWTLAIDVLVGLALGLLVAWVASLLAAPIIAGISDAMEAR